MTDSGAAGHATFLHDGHNDMEDEADNVQPCAPLNSSFDVAKVGSLNFNRWCASIAFAVLRTRTKFSSFLRATLHLQRSGCASSSAAFPLPVPFPGAFARMPPGLSSTKRKRRNLHRAVHVVVMALNFWWSGSCFIPLEHLERAPSKSQQTMLRRIVSLMLADGPREDFEVLASGRKFHHLIARLADLSDCLTKLGAGACPYDKKYPGHSVPLDSQRFPELEPYKSLDAGRLKVVGMGNFDATSFLEPELCMAYRYPDSLLYDNVPRPGEYPMHMDKMSEVVSLAKLWDVRGLLRLHSVDLQHERPHELVRVFNCLKNESCDRQIGDRRGRNLCEQRVIGPSSRLPTGVNITDMYVDAACETLSIICTDRRDFYHQFATSSNRSLSNTVGPRIPLSLLSDTNAFKDFQAERKARKPTRLSAGDHLGISERQSFQPTPKGECMISFSSIFQGDHAGVEIATSAHEGLLQSVGLLSEESRLLSSAPFLGDALCEGLVIDDYFCIAKVQRGILVASPALDCLKTCKEVYRKHDILGSDDKDVVGERTAKLIGAHVNASEEAQSRGHTIVAAPPQKRYALSWVSLQLCQLTHTTDSLHLCLVGAWTSVLMFRRQVMSVLQNAFHLVNAMEFNPSNPQLVKLTRPVATELTLLAALAPLCTADISVDFAKEIFATDASLSKGAIVGCEIDRELHEVLWRTCRSKGGYSKLLTPGQTVLARTLGLEEEEPTKTESIRRPLAYRFDFVEIFAGAATVTREVSALGYSVCCPIDLSFDVELNLEKVHVLEWLLHLIDNRFVKSWMVEPPCTTFSVMRQPALRSKACPFGFDLDDEQTRIGTLLGHRALQILKAGCRSGVTGVLENPWTSKIKFLPAWIIAVEDENCQLVRCDSCAYGSIHLKSFAFLCCWAVVDAISLRCSGDHVHVPVEGQYTKQSATYVPALSKALASVMAQGIERLNHFDDELVSGRVDGLENQLVNNVSLCAPWQLVSVWDFPVTLHINLLELSAVVRLVQRLVKRGVPVRVVILVDSNVIRCAAAKGRSSARALRKALSRLSALCVGGGIYPVYAFCPTRYNVADDPTRDAIIRSPIPGIDFSCWSRSDLFALSLLPKLKRWASNWVRLAVLLCGPSVLRLRDLSKFRRPRFPFGLQNSAGAAPSHDLGSSMDFDATLGFPGEGPFSLCHSLVRVVFPVVVVGFSCLSSHGVDAVLWPRNAGDLARQTTRQSRPPLQEGRPVLSGTNRQRVDLLTQFENWLATISVSLTQLLDDHHSRIDEINRLLVRYGRALYAAGRPYNHYAETINSLAAKKPAIRRQLQESWNLAFAWVRDEPSVHHNAMPWQILVAALSACLLWGWTEVAGMLALCWGSLLRIGEFTQAVRKDLLLPVDTNYTNGFALLSLREPKTRFTAARHQSAKLDVPDLLRVVHLAFSNLRPHQKLWQMSGQTLRTRFRQVLQEIGISETVRINGKGLDLGSLRPGGATWILQQTEDGEFVRRRGRWINQRVMEIYLQEVTAFQFLAAVPQKSRTKIFTLCDAFPAILHDAEQFFEAGLQPSVWWHLWPGQVTR